MRHQDSNGYAQMQGRVHYTPQYIPTRTTYTPRFAHDRDGHRDQERFLAALERHPAVRSVRRTAPEEDERTGVDAWVGVVGTPALVPIDVTTRDRSASGAADNLLATLRRGTVPVVIEQAALDAELTPERAYAAFVEYRHLSDQFFQARHAAGFR